MLMMQASLVDSTFLRPCPIHSDEIESNRIHFNVSHGAGAPVAAATAASIPTTSSSDPLADAGHGDLFWDIVKGRVDMTPPPIGDLDYSRSPEEGGQSEGVAEGPSEGSPADAKGEPVALGVVQRAVLRQRERAQEVGAYGVFW